MKEANQKLNKKLIKFAPYSASKLKCFSSCPQQFKLKYIDKEPVREEPKVFFEKGTFVHWVLEHFPNTPEKPFEFKLGGTKEKEEWLGVARGVVKKKDISIMLKNRLVSEIKFMIDFDFEAHSDLPKEYQLLMGYIDYIGIDDEGNLLVIDWKTGRSRQADDLQLRLYALWCLLSRINLNKVKAGFVYVEQDFKDIHDYYRADLKEHVLFFINKINEIETCSDFKKKPGKFCEFCDYQIKCKPFTYKVKLKF